MRLNVIGNGFDLYHGLPSNYYYYGCYLIDNDPEFYSEVGEMYSIRTMMPVGPSIIHEYDYAVENLFWRDFESQLGEVNEYYVVGTNDYDLGLENDDPIDIEMNHHQNAESMKKSFARWVNETLNQKDNFNLIKGYLRGELEAIKFDDDEVFVTFNYTHILQEVYGIDDNKIHFMHGECTGDDDDDLVIGHGNNCRIEEIRLKIKEMEENYSWNQAERNTINEYECLLTYLKKIRKDVDLCKSMSKYFYMSKCKNVEIIRVIGLSLGEVDVPYLVDMRNKFKNAKWEFSFYSEFDEQRINEVAMNVLNLTQDEYSIFRLSSPVSNTIKEQIVQLRNINEYDTFPSNRSTNPIA